MIILILSLTFFVKSPLANGEGWLEGYSFRKSHIINHTIGSGEDYQILIKVYYSSGTDGTEIYNGMTIGKVYLDNSNYPFQTDFDDVAFTDNDGETVLSKYLEDKTDSNYAIFWIKINDDLTSNDVTIYIYWGNEEATLSSSGSDVFVWFDNGDSDLSSSYTMVNLYKVDQNGVWYYYLTDHDYRMYIDSTKDTEGIVINSVSGSNYAIQSKCKIATVTTNDQLGIILRYSSSGVYDCRRLSSSGAGYKGQDICKEPTPPNEGLNQLTTTTPANHFTVGTFYYQWGGIYSDSIIFYFSLNDITVSTTDSSYSSGQFGLYSGYDSQYRYFDDILIRKFCYPEPSHGSFGNVEEYSPESNNIQISLNSPNDNDILEWNNSVFNFGYTPLIMGSDYLNNSILYINSTFISNNQTSLVNNTISFISVTFTSINASYEWFVRLSNSSDYIDSETRLLTIVVYIGGGGYTENDLESNFILGGLLTSMGIFSFMFIIYDKNRRK